MPRTLHARWILPFVLAAAAWAVWRDARALHWRELRPGLEFATLRGEPWCRRGSSAIALLRVDPARERVRVRHFSLEHPGGPLSVVEWQARTGADAVFNAGQYYPDWSYMGLLVSGGRVVSDRPHPGFLAALVADPRTLPPDRAGPEPAPDPAAGAAAVLDLARTPLDPDSLRWREVAQSFMLLDDRGALRTRRSERVANRTLVAQDRRGRLVVLVTEGGYTLADLAELLRRAPRTATA
ncbi:MAG TPA: phosphodiester glycosidase family protein [Candidatus Eisenbacteria bacterium]|nr:phosphodiester glycosidase family protein [Candidatus Eisenbacteria bacterium]